MVDFWPPWFNFYNWFSNFEILLASCLWMNYLKVFLLKSRFIFLIRTTQISWLLKVVTQENLAHLHIFIYCLAFFSWWFYKNNLNLISKIIIGKLIAQYIVQLSKLHVKSFVKILTDIIQQTETFYYVELWSVSR